MIWAEVIGVRVGLYARVSHSNGDQTPENQLLALRQHAAAQGWEIAGEYVDTAPANGKDGRANRRRTAWARMLKAAAAKEFDAILVVRLDRAFRSTLDAADTLANLKRWGVAFKSLSEPMLDTTAENAMSEFVTGLLALVAAFERNLIRDRTLEGLRRARAQGWPVGRPGWRLGVKRTGERGKAAAGAEAEQA